MKDKVMKVRKAGLGTSVQDKGRYGFQAQGMTTSGAMDQFAFEVANMLTGNMRDAACLEIILMGPQLEVLQDATVAITGADLTPMLDGKPVTMWKAFQVKKGQQITFGQARNGKYAYLAIRGGIDVPVVMGSMSTFARAEIGGLDGKFAEVEDVLVKGEKEAFPLKSLQGLARDLQPDYRLEKPFRVIAGPDEAKFSAGVRAAFIDSTFYLSADSDRMGYRLDGPAMKMEESEMLSDAIMPGAIQMTNGGQPIVMLRDRQTTGGYPRIATMATVDISRFTQIHSKLPIRFEEISVEKAQELYRKEAVLLERIYRQVQDA